MPTKLNMVKSHRTHPPWKIIGKDLKFLNGPFYVPFLTSKDQTISNKCFLLNSLSAADGSSSEALEIVHN